MIARPGRWVICGPPASGKSTYVRARARPGDLVWDLDAVASLVGYGGAVLPRGRRLPWPVAKAALVMRDALVEWLAVTDTIGDARVFVIISDMTAARECAHQIGGQVVAMPGRDEPPAAGTSWRWRDAARHEGAVT